MTKKRLEPRRKPRQARSQATVEAILDAAARVFARSGYAATTTNHVARKAGVSIGSLYEYFPSKEALLVALTERHVDEAERELTALFAALPARAGALSLEDLVTTLVRAMVDLHAHDPGLHRVLFEQAPLPPRLRDRVAGLETAMAEQLARLLEPYGLAPTDARTAAAMAVQVAEGLTHRLVLHDAGSASASAPATVDAWVAEISELLLGYLERKRGRSRPAGASRGRARAVG